MLAGESWSSHGSVSDERLSRLDVHNPHNDIIDRLRAQAKANEPLLEGEVTSEATNYFGTVAVEAVEVESACGSVRPYPHGRNACEQYRSCAPTKDVP